MENFKWFDKWYSKHVIDHHKEDLKIELKTKKDMGWILVVDFKNTKYKHLSLMEETKKVSDYNYYSIQTKEKYFKAEGDFTKLDFLFGKFRAFIGESDMLSAENDFFLNPDIQRFIFQEYPDSLVFLHYTYEEDVAMKIIKNGFQFSVAFDKTTTSVFKDPIDLNYNHMIRKPFGKYVIVICISKELHKKYSEKLSKLDSKYIKVEEILSETPLFKNASDESIYTLHKSFVKGYFNYTTGEIIKNKTYNPAFDSEQFILNIEKV
jgi:hypothetical protein